MLIEAILCSLRSTCSMVGLNENEFGGVLTFFFIFFSSVSSPGDDDMQIDEHDIVAIDDGEVFKII